MSLKIVPYTDDLVPAVRAMNERLKEGGETWGFYRNSLPYWVPRGDDPSQTVWQECYLVRSEDKVHGGFVLKPQQFFMEGTETWMATWQGPVSEGLVDPKLAAVAMLCLRDMGQKQPQLFTWGGSPKLLQLLDAFGWSRTGTALQISILNAGRFLREARVLRTSDKRRRALDLLAASGLAGAGAALWRLAHRAGTRRLEAQPVDQLGPEMDEIWTTVRDSYGCIAARDVATVNRLIAPDHWPHGKLYQFTYQGRPVGWGAVRVTAKEDDRRFGNMTVGAILDALALPGYEADVCAALSRILAAQKPDMIITHMTHKRWRRGLKRSGFVEMQRRRAFCAIPELADKLGNDLDGFLEKAHLTPIDADGPHGL